MKDWAKLSESRTDGGKFTEKSRLGLLKTDKDVQGRQRRVKNIEEYAQDDLSEREDEDIYAHYME